VAATDLAFAPRGKIELASMVLQDVEEIGVTAGGKRPAGWVDPRSAKGCCGVTGSDGPPWAEGLLVIGAVWLGLLRRRRSCAR
jgi:MYXO-CTERM domain-containing protein